MSYGIDIEAMDSSEAMDSDGSSSSGSDASFVCDICQGFGDMKNPRGFVMKVEPDELEWRNRGASYVYMYMHHPHVAALLASAEAGCNACAIICQSLKRFQSSFDEECARYSLAQKPNPAESVAHVSTQMNDDTSTAVQFAEVAKQTRAFTEGRLKTYDNGRVVLIFYCDKESGPRAYSGEYKVVTTLALTTPLLLGYTWIFNSPYDPLDTEYKHRPSRDLLSGPHIGLINRWKDTCKMEHKSCRRTAYIQPLPSRVLELSDPVVKECVCGVRLIETHGTMQGTYACLSYCWGDPETQSQTKRTTRANLLKQLQAISLDSLPSTIIDTIHLCYKLGFRFLWVDKLCIIQDDEKDWEYEASKMCDIYSKSALTVSVPLCIHSSQSFLRKRQSAHRFGGKGEYAVMEYTDEKSSRKGCLWLSGAALSRSNASWFLENNWDDFRGISSYCGNYWITRGWTFQEWMLSPRVLHIDTMTLWDCFEGYANELNRRHTERAHLLRHPEAFGVEISWDFIVAEYTSRQITYEKDRLPALAGLAAGYRQNTGYTYLAGLWLEEMPRALMWQRTGKTPPHVIQGLPSWSWASVSSRTFYTYDFDRTTPVAPPFIPSARVTHWHCPPSSVPAMGKAHIDIKGYISIVEGMGDFEDSDSEMDYQVKAGNELWESKQDHELKNLDDEIAQFNILLLVLGSVSYDYDSSPNCKAYGGLVLQRCGWDDGRQCFRRFLPGGGGVSK